ncbi:MAG: aminotransferase class I/II-fold pyridoxal phosphate-dependent enzyme [Pseudomonadota bacterium]
MKPRTRVNHPMVESPTPGNTPLVAPIYQSVKFEFQDLAETERAWAGSADGYHYSRVGNPTVRTLERTLSDLQGKSDCVVVGSGLAAVAVTLLALLSQGDHVLAFVETYGPTRGLLARTLARFGVRHTLLSIEDHAGIERVLATTPTRLVWFESPTNPVLKIADIQFLTDVARRYGALTALDNTFAGLESHGQFDVDLYVHSLTKYASGHGDVMGGAVIGNAALVGQVRGQAIALGPTLDPHAAYLIQRGLKTYHLRRTAQCASAAIVAEHLAVHPNVERVRYPGLAADVGHALASRQMSDFGTVVSVDLRGTAEQSRTFADSLQLFAIAASLGSTESLIVPPQLQQPRDLTEQQRVASGITATTARLSIGVEDPEDLIADLDSALAAAFGS